jgi:O-antigen/teichoic acid export membrane protein
LSKNKLKYLKEKERKITSSEKKEVNKFIIPASAVVFTAIFFGSIDMVMLGRFVPPEFIGYYRAALGLAAAMAPFVSFVLLPVFSRLKGKQLERGFKKSVSVTLSFSLLLAFSVFLLSPFIINFIYGLEYQTSINILRLFSLLLISSPILLIYSTYFTSKGKPIIVMKTLAVSIIINIFLNLLAIYSLASYGNLIVVYGVTAATIISNWFYMIGLVIFKKRGF